MIVEFKEVLYTHDCKVMGCPVLKKSNKEPCQFCGTKKFQKTIRKLKKNVFPLEEESDT